ncbi:MAG: hypothetical protein RDU41_10700, partial [Clostridia bacterium]|nr:hypothetical protein [Clostridia bacterium]
MSEDKNQPLQPQLVELYNDLLALVAPEEAVSFDPVDYDIRQRWKEGTPLLGCVGFQIDPAAFFGLMEKMREVMQKFQPERLAELDQALKVMPADAEGRTRLIDRVLRRDSTAVDQLIDEHKVADDVVTFL